MNKLIGLLSAHPKVSDYKIAETKTDSYELFFVHEKLETVRATSTAHTAVTVYCDHDGTRGDSAFTVYGSMTEKEIAAKIDEAAARAALVFNEPYSLPEGGVCLDALPTNFDSFEPKELAERIAKAVFSANCPEGGSINALEVFLYTDTFRILNSRGVDKTQVTHRAMIEAIPTFTDEKESVELYEDYRFTIFDEEKLKEEIAEKLREVRDRRKAEKPPVPLQINVLLRPHEIMELAWELADDLNYASVYAHANLHKIGDDLQPSDDCDKLTVTLRAVTPGSERSARFDGDGLDLTDTVVIEKGAVKNNYGSSRFGQYLGVEKPSGDLGCMNVCTGTLSDGELQKAPYIECASLSGIQLDLYNDYIGGEIRLAYYFDGEKKIPVSGISMSGKLSDVLSALRLSDRRVIDGSYEGPALLMLSGMTVL